MGEDVERHTRSLTVKLISGLALTNTAPNLRLPTPLRRRWQRFPAIEHGILANLRIPALACRVNDRGVNDAEDEWPRAHARRSTDQRIADDPAAGNTGCP